jgi:hypothetical protein
MVIIKIVAITPVVSNSSNKNENKWGDKNLMLPVYFCFRRAFTVTASVRCLIDSVID